MHGWQTASSTSPLARHAPLQAAPHAQLPVQPLVGVPASQQHNQELTCRLYSKQLEQFAGLQPGGRRRSGSGTAAAAGRGANATSATAATAAKATAPRIESMAQVFSGASASAGRGVEQRGSGVRGVRPGLQVVPNELSKRHVLDRNAHGPFRHHHGNRRHCRRAQQAAAAIEA